MIYLSFVIPFIAFGLLFYYMDIHTNIIRYKCNDKDRLKGIYKKILPVVLFNLFFLHPLLTYFTSYFITVTEGPFEFLTCLKMAAIYEISL